MIVKRRKFLFSCVLKTWWWKMPLFRYGYPTGWQRPNSTWWQLNYRTLFPQRTFFICWLIQLYVLDMLKFLNGSLSKLVKCWYCQQGSATNTCICAARLISSSRSLSVELLVCWPDPRKRLILWSILLAIDTCTYSKGNSLHCFLWHLDLGFLYSFYCTNYCALPLSHVQCCFLCLPCC